METEQDPFMRKARKVQDEIEKKMIILKQLEGVYRTSSNKHQRRRVLKEIKALKHSIHELENIHSLQQQYGLVRDEEEIGEEDDFTLLNTIVVNKFRDESRDTEMDAIVSYVEYFEQNYLPILSEYYLKLDYNHSMKRDSFYPRFMEIKKAYKEYGYEVEVQSKEEYDSIAVYKDKSIVFKMRQRYLMALDRYFKDLDNIMVELMDDHASGGSIILNPLEFVNMSEFEVDRKLDGYTVIDALIEMHTFFEEFIRFLAIPNI
jgi:hypothetical protein